MTPEVAINMEIFVRSRFYHIFAGPSDSRRNAYRLVCVLYIALVQCILAFGFSGFFVDMEDAVSDVDLLLMAMSQAQIYLCTLKMVVLLSNADAVRALFDVARVDFLRADPCRRYAASELRRSRDRAVRNTRLYVVLVSVVFMQWIVFPLAFNAYAAAARHPSDGVDNDEAAVLVLRRTENIVNWRYPISVRTHNRYYIAFYLAETIIGSYCFYCITIIDSFLMSFCWVIMAQHKVLCRAFSNVGCGDSRRVRTAGEATGKRAKSLEGG